MITTKEIVAWLREQVFAFTTRSRFSERINDTEAQATLANHAEIATAAANALEAQDALAGQNVQLREALKGVQEIAENAECPACGASIGEHVNGGYYNEDGDWTCHGRSLAGTEDVVWQIDAIKAMQSALALALPLPQAAAQVAEWREKAGLLEDLLNPEIGRRGDSFSVNYNALGGPFQQYREKGLEFIKTTITRLRAGGDCNDRRGK
jgi:hypothetical protein